MPLYSEHYRLLTAAGSPLGDREKVTWAEVGKVPLCLLTPDMQNRRIIERPVARRPGPRSAPTLESNSIIVLFAHVRTGRWASDHAGKARGNAGADRDAVRAIPIVEPEAAHSIGLVVPQRKPMTPLINALVAKPSAGADPGGRPLTPRRSGAIRCD